MSEARPASAEGHFTIRIQGDLNGDKLSFHKQIDGQTVARIMNLIYLAGSGASTGPVSSVTADTPVTSDGDVVRTPVLSFPEFLERLHADNNFKRIAAIALYHRDHLRQRHVLRDDIPGWFQKAGLPAPKNVSRDIRYAVKRGLIAEDLQQEGAFYVTRKGEEQLQSTEEE